jgi:hypothetical protein
MNEVMLAVIIAIAAIAAVLLLLGISGNSASYLLNPPPNIGVMAALAISLMLGLLHGATPDEHTWPITFSYAVGSYSSVGGAKAGLAFSTGFTLQRALLSTLGFLGLAAVYKAYNLDGPVYVVVGVVMVMAGAYILNKGRYLHFAIDSILGGALHHTAEAERIQPHEASLRSVPVKMAVVHGLIAGFGFGPYATIITFMLAPRMPSLIFAPLPGLFFGIGTMLMQIIFGIAFASLARARKLSEKDISYIGRQTGGRTLYYGGMLFAAIGALVIAFPAIENVAVSTGNPIPNLNVVGLSTILVLVVVGIIGLGNLIYAIAKAGRGRARKKNS